MNAKSTLVTLGALVLFGAATYGIVSEPVKPATQDTQAAAQANDEIAERTSAAQAAMARIDQTANWPADPKQLVLQFWEAASRKDFDAMVTMCPGAKAGDFEPYYGKWVPKPATAVGDPEPHPTEPGILLYPAKVPFPGFPNKTIKLAVVPGPNNRPIIDGRYSIWW
ncbi:MAG: hypothetical protein RLY93_08710 [Sumerlaeia bacterium]